jgi:hypothetical protein
MRPPCPPFSPCWCEQNPTNPRCSETLPLSFEISAVIISSLIIYVVFKFFNKNKLESKP